MNKKQIKKPLDRRKHVLNLETPFTIQEAYKTARTNLIFSLATSKRKIIVFTSCSPSEGKSTSCINMAITLAEMGAKVLMIDADLRKPTIHKTLNIKNKVGLSALLSGYEKVGQAINKEVRNNLDVIIAGIIPPNPAELLSSQNMVDLLEAFNEHYDYVLLDTPPVNLVTDSQQMNDIIAGIVFVVKENITTHNDIEEAFRRIKLTNGKVLGFIKTNCNTKHNSKYKGDQYSYK